VPRAGSTSCPACGVATAALALLCDACDAPLQPPERRVATLLFADLTGYTSLCQELDPEVVHLQFSPLMRRLRRVAEDLGGLVEGVQGDGFMALWGAPLAREDDALRAVQAAAEMQRLVTDWRRAHPQIPLQGLHAGVHCGEVLASAARSSTGIQVTGDAVNVASRLCSAAAAEEVLVSSPAIRLTHRSERFANPRALLVRNRTQPVDVSSLLWTDDRSLAGGRTLTVSQPLINRHGALQRMDELTAEQPDGSVKVLLTVIGEVGVGKSRVCEHWLGSREGWLVIRTSVPAFGADPFTATLRGAVQHLTADADDPMGVLRDWCDGELSEVTERRLARVLGLPVGAHEQDSADEVAQALTLWLHTVAVRHPVTILVDDAHWADEALLRWLAELVAPDSPGRLVVLTTTRPDAPAARSTPSIELAPLSPQDTQDLIERLLPGSPPDLARHVGALVAGNPLFAEECAALLIDKGTVELTEAGAVLRHPERLGDVPPSLRLFITARLDLLSPAARQVVRACAVANDSSTPALLAHLCSDSGVPDATNIAGITDITDITAGMAEALERGLLDIAGEQVRFRHSLVREVCYEGQSLLQRSRTHRLTSRWLAGQPRASAARADHAFGAFELALRAGAPGLDELAQEATRAVLADGRTALQRDTRLATRRAGQACAIADSTAPSAQNAVDLLLLELDLGLAQGSEADLIATAEQGLQLAGTLGQGAVAALQLRLGRALVTQHQLPAAVATLQEAHEGLQASGDRSGAARALIELAFTVDEGLQPVIDAETAAFHAAQLAGEHLLAMETAADLAALTAVSDARLSRRWQATTLQLADVADVCALGWVDLARGYCHGYALEWEQTASLAERALDSGRQCGQIQLFNSAGMMRAEALAATGRLQQCRDLGAQLRPLFAARVNPRAHFELVLSLSLAAIRAGELDEHQRLLGEATGLDLPATDIPSLWIYEALGAQHRGLTEQPAQLAQRAVEALAVIGHSSATLHPLVIRLRALVGTPAAPRAAELALAAADHNEADLARGTIQRWLRLHHRLSGDPSPAPLDPPDARDAEQQALDHEHAGLVTGDPGRLEQAVAAWSQLGASCWSARAQTWFSLATGEAAPRSATQELLSGLGAPEGLVPQWSEQWRAARA
jgi:class 3 adenylate cyclase